MPVVGFVTSEALHLIESVQGCLRVDSVALLALAVL